MDERDESERVD
jgi:uracil-DNA glycosylase